MGKTVPSTKFTEWKGLDRISTIVHEMGCIFRELSKDDFGLDGEIEVVTPKASGQGFETTGGIVKVQAKSGKSYIISDTPASFATPIERNDLDYWHRCTFPVLFIVYHPADDKLYFKEIKSYIRSTPNAFRPPFKIEFDKSKDEFTASSKSSICRHASVSQARISFEQQERLLSNLLPVKKLPKYLTYAPTRRKTDQSIRDEIEGFVPPFTVADGKLYTLGNLFDDNCVLQRWCGKRIRKMLASEWSEDAARVGDFVYLLNQLLGIHRRRCGIRYNRDFGRAYFPRENDTDLEFKREWTSVRTGKPSRPRIVAKYYEYGAFKFWRHLAAQLSFRHFGAAWSLQVVPKYFFTDDGEKPSGSDLVGAYTTSLKAKEHNSQVLNHVLFWADVLSQREPTIKIKLSGKTVMVIEKMPACGIASFAIPDDPATYEEKAPSVQASLFDQAGDEDEEEDDED